MVLKSRKSNSKRYTLKHKHKILRKVKQHHAKKAKEERKARKAGIKPKAPKDPGIPAQWPFKEELLKDLEWQKQRILAEERAKKEARKLKRAAERDAADDADMAEPLSAEQLRQQAEQAEAGFVAKKKARLAAPSADGDKDGSRRAFFKEFAKVVAAADVIIEVLDARDPLGSRCLDMERFVRRSGADKKIVLLLNKIDLVPKEVAEAWLKYLREELPAVAFRCTTQRQAAHLKQGRRGKAGGRGAKAAAAPVSAAYQGSDCLGADTLLQLLKNYARSRDIKTAITVGVVGLPNVGKSSLINSLKRARVAQVGNAPGVTRAVQQVSLDRNISLLDSPGIAFTDAGAAGDSWAALRNCVRVEQLADPQAVVAEILRRCSAKQLTALYKVPAFKDADEFLQHVAFQRGKLLPGGVGDAASAARVVLHDWHNGRIAYYTLPPARGDGQHEEAAIVSGWGEAFDADKVYANEQSAVIAGLPSLEDEPARFFQTTSAGAAAADFDAMAAEPVLAGPSSDGDSSSDSDSEAGSEGGNSDNDAALPAGLRQPREAKAPKGAAAKAGAGQADKLYGEEGQFNPHAARAERKRRRKERRVRLGDDFDFAEAFADEVQLGAGGGGDSDAEGSMSSGDEVPE